MVGEYGERGVRVIVNRHGIGPGFVLLQLFQERVVIDGAFVHLRGDTAVLSAVTERECSERLAPNAVTHELLGLDQVGVVGVRRQGRFDQFLQQ